jgi:hypothetical protein
MGQFAIWAAAAAKTVTHISRFSFLFFGFQAANLGLLGRFFSRALNCRNWPSHAKFFLIRGGYGALFAPRLAC